MRAPTTRGAEAGSEGCNRLPGRPPDTKAEWCRSNSSKLSFLDICNGKRSEFMTVELLSNQVNQAGRRIGSTTSARTRGVDRWLRKTATELRQGGSAARAETVIGRKKKRGILVTRS